MRTRPRCFVTVCTVLYALQFGPPVWAQEDPAEPLAEPEIVEPEPAQPATLSGGSGWRFELAPYFWAAGIGTEISAGEIDATSEVSFDDVLDVLKFGAMGHFEARKGKWGFFTDLMYVKIGDTVTTRVLRDRLPLGLRVKIDADLAQIIAEGGVLYRIGNERRSVDLLAGVRYFNFDIDIETRLFDGSRKRDWLDPIIGARFQAAFTDKWGVVVRGDIGGFGVSSEFTWSATALFSYRLSEHWHTGLGYKYLEVDYEQGDFEYDGRTHGPIMGFSYRF